MFIGICWSPVESSGVQWKLLSPVESGGFQWIPVDLSNGIHWNLSGRIPETPPEFGEFQRTPVDPTWTGHGNLAHVTPTNSRI